ncbi:MAG: NAD(+) diphosphatase [Ruminococcus sp.]|nr:NAD(+) diphosphatase [Ruminococcus sp.]
MIQDIYPSRLDNSFTYLSPDDGDHLLYFDESGRLLSKAENGALFFTAGAKDGESVYLFSVDDKRYFLSFAKPDEIPEGFGFRTIRELRDSCTGKEVFIAFTAFHLWKWYADNKFCGKCGGKLSCDKTERALVCRDCGGKIYPRINPAVIVGVIKGDCLLITRYRRGYAHNALVAGFTEIGETLEQTVEREVMEETGVKVKNIRYCKSQPWGMAQDILMGFFCEADGDVEIRMDESELKYAEWVKREDIVLQPNNFSLTNEMMRVFRDNEI